MGKTEIVACLYVEEGLVNIDGKNSVNSDDGHYNGVGLVVSKVVEFLGETVERRGL